MRSCFIIIILISAATIAYRAGYNKATTNIQPVVQAQTVQLSTNEVKEQPAAPEKSSDESKNMTHIVATGETLFLIGLKYDVMWTTIAEANNITENTPLVAGSKLIIPITKSGDVSRSETLNIDGDESKRVQEAVKHGEQQWRKDILEVVKRTIPIDYHYRNDDTLSLTAQDNTAGTAVVILEHETNRYRIELVQPQEKGDNGVWYIAKIGNE